jgi:hypothetical protein
MVIQKISSEAFRSLFYGFFRRTARFIGNQAQNFGRVIHRLKLNTAAPFFHNFIVQEQYPLANLEIR